MIFLRYTVATPLQSAHLLSVALTGRGKWCELECIQTSIWCLNSASTAAIKAFSISWFVASVGYCRLWFNCIDSSSKHNKNPFFKDNHNVHTSFPWSLLFSGTMLWVRPSTAVDVSFAVRIAIFQTPDPQTLKMEKFNQFSSMIKFSSIN